MKREGLAAGVVLFLGLLSCLGGAESNESEFWTVPKGATRALLKESDHKYQTHDPIKLYGKLLGLMSHLSNSPYCQCLHWKILVHVSAER